MDWMTLVERVGIPMAILFAIGIFLYAKAWPFLVSQITTYNKERTDERRIQNKEREDFINALHKITSERTEENARIQEFLKLVEREREGSSKIANAVDNLSIRIQAMHENDEKVIQQLISLTNSVNELRKQITKDQKTERKVRRTV